LANILVRALLASNTRQAVLLWNPQSDRDSRKKRKKSIFANNFFINRNTWQECAALCVETPGCKYWTWDIRGGFFVDCFFFFAIYSCEVYFTLLNTNYYNNVCNADKHKKEVD
jgi:hypothetical protein